MLGNGAGIRELIREIVCFERVQSKLQAILSQKAGTDAFSQRPTGAIAHIVILGFDPLQTAKIADYRLV